MDVPRASILGSPSWATKMQSSDLPQSVADIVVGQYQPPTECRDTRDIERTPTGPAPPPPICGVCQRAVDVNAPVKVLTCTHILHVSCADRWLRMELHCPTCKNQVIFPVAKPAVICESEARVPLGSHGAARPSPLNGTDARLYGICRDCQQVFYRNPRVIKPETNAWYRCPRCRRFDAVSMVRASCTLQ